MVSLLLDFTEQLDRLIRKKVINNLIDKYSGRIQIWVYRGEADGFLAAVTMGVKGAKPP